MFHPPSRGWRSDPQRYTQVLKRLSKEMASRRPVSRSYSHTTTGITIDKQSDLLMMHKLDIP